MRPAEFVAALGGVFEHSPWIAERAFASRPFADTGALHAAMVDVVR
ncbi:MAG: 2-oxo-4-hydroxy-4-carboxy-5-ureidoimidazoline decarboxylase, partial [Burkholderiales bacterium]